MQLREVHAGLLGSAHHLLVNAQQADELLARVSVVTHKLHAILQATAAVLLQQAAQRAAAILVVAKAQGPTRRQRVDALLLCITGHNCYEHSAC